MPFTLKANRDKLTLDLAVEELGDAIVGARKLDAHGWNDIKLVMPDGELKTIDDLYELEWRGNPKRQH